MWGRLATCGRLAIGLPLPPENLPAPMVVVCGLPLCGTVSRPKRDLPDRVLSCFDLLIRSLLPISCGPVQGLPFSTRAFISEYAVSISLPSAAAFVAVPGFSFTWRMNLPAPCNK